MNIYDDLTLVIVSYRSEKLILKNLDILKKFKTIIIDNSNSSELELIVKYINNIDNWFFYRGLLWCSSIEIKR